MGRVAFSPESCASIQRDLDSQRPAPVEEKPQASIYVGGHTAVKQLDVKRPRSPGRRQVEPGPAMCPCSKEGKWYP